jgi:flagellar motor switch protein FliG
MSAAIANQDPATALDVTKLTRSQKLAALLIVLGPESAAEVLRGLGEQEVAAVTTAMAGLPVIDQRLQREILRDFSDLAVTATTGVRGGVEFAQSTLEKALGASQARSFMGRIAPGSGTGSAMNQLVEKDAKQLFKALNSERPQAVALVASFLDRKKASELLAMFSDETRAELVERLAMLGPTPVSVVETLGNMLLKRIGTHATMPFNQTGGVQPTATVLKAMNRDASKALIEALEKRNPELGKSIRNQMFTFEDVGRLDVAALQKVLREIDSRTLATALTSASESLKAKLLSGLSKRAAEAINEEMGFLGKVKAKDIEMSQMSIIEIVRRLESDGQIEITEEQTS